MRTAPGWQARGPVEHSASSAATDARGLAQAIGPNIVVEETRSRDHLRRALGAALHHDASIVAVELVELVRDRSYAAAVTAAASGLDALFVLASVWTDRPRNQPPRKQMHTR
ncbi:hypothetical protein [Nocardia sp. NPDC005825]|uniref:hypothetical protein n=1 Tax=unclassified Nocardia TaxID=2637762 RepID=UPI0033DFC5B7